MTRGRAIALALLAGGTLWTVSALRRGPQPTKLPPLEPRGQLVRGVEVFAFGRYHPAQLADMAHAVHGAAKGLLGRPTSATGLRIQTFPDAPSCAAYTARATGIARPTAAYVFLGNERLVVLHPGVDESSIQHELAHDAVDRAYGSAPRWFTEGVATHLEGWLWTNDGLVPHVDPTWANRLLERARPEREVEAGEGFLTGDEKPSYARSWATMAVLLLLRRGEGPLEPDHGLDREALDDLGLAVAEHWSWPQRRVETLLAAASSAEGERREALLSLAELAAERLQPNRDPLLVEPELARAIRDRSLRPERRLRAAVAAVAAVTSAHDWVRLSEEAESRGAPRMAERALECGRLRSHAVETQGTSTVERMSDFATIKLTSSSWDRLELERLAERALKAIALLKRYLPALQATCSVRVELPNAYGARESGTSDLSLEGWPEDPLLAEGFAKAILEALADPQAQTPLATWERAGLLEAMRGELDPVHGTRLMGEARSAVHGPYGVAASVSDEAFPLASPFARALAALRIRATTSREAPASWSAACQLVAIDQPERGDATLTVATDPGRVAPERISLDPEHSRFFLLAALHGGGGASYAQALAELLRRDGHERAAGLLERIR